MVILIVHNRYREGGGEDTVAENETALLRSKGHTVITYYRDNSEIDLGNPLKALGLVFATVFNIRTYKEVRRIIRNRKVDVVHVHNTLPLVSPSVYYAAEKEGVPVIQTVHNFRFICPDAKLYRDGRVCEDCVKHGLKCALAHSCYRGSRLQTFLCVLSSMIHRSTGIYRKIDFICLTDFNKEMLLKINRGRIYIDPRRVHVKPNFMPDSCDKEDVHGLRAREGFLFAGRLDETKGIRVLLDAWSILGLDAPLLKMAGDGELYDPCKERIEKEGLNIDLIGRVDHRDVIELMKSCRALLFPSLWYEGFPMTLAEAFGVKTPVIASDIGNGADLVSKGKNGLLFRAGDAADLAEKIRESDSLLSSEIYDRITLPKGCGVEENYNALIRIYKRAISMKKGVV